MSHLCFFYRRVGGSPEIRGRQIATYLSARINPTDVGSDDICICVGQSPQQFARERGIFKQHGPLYLDIIDHYQLLPNLPSWGNFLTVIALSRVAAKYIRSVSPMTPVICIPQHHANFDREQRIRTDIQTVGCIGFEAGKVVMDDVVRGVEALGMKFISCSSYGKREEVLDFYRQIDIQVMWRWEMPEHIIRLKNAMRLATAGSFGIPTVARPEPAIEDEFGGAYVPANTVDEVIAGVERLCDPIEYAIIAKETFVQSEYYHISNIAKLYRQLEEGAVHGQTETRWRSA